jgi:hypothetical protein
VRRPIAFLAISFLFGTTFYVASHVISESRAAAAAIDVQVPEQQRPAPAAPTQVNPTPTAPKQDAAKAQKHVEETAKPELLARHNEQSTEREKRKELCRKLEQRRQELRHEQEAQAQPKPGSAH